MLSPHQDYRTLIREEFEARNEHNPNYSLRAFARDLAISPSRLSEVLSGKTGLSREAAEKIGRKMGLSQKYLDYFCELVDASHARSQTKRKLAQVRLLKLSQAFTWPTLELDTFKAVADWYHFGILELSLLKGFRSDPEWIAEQLGIKKIQAEAAIERLLRLNLLYWEDTKPNKTLKASTVFTDTPHDVPSSALKQFHTQLLKKALSHLQTQPVEEREFNSTLVAVSQKDLPKIKSKIRRFRDRLCKELSESPQKDALYSLCIQFFRLNDSSAQPVQISQKDSP